MGKKRATRKTQVNTLINNDKIKDDIKRNID